MLHEYRTYTLHPAQFAEYVRLASERAIPIRGNDYGRLLVFWVSEAGTLCQVHHIWEYASLDARQAERARMWANDRWRDEFIALAWPTMQRQEVRFMTPRMEFVAPGAAQALYEARIYHTVVGKFIESAAAVQQRPLAQGATRVGCWTCESPEPNQIVEVIAYADAATRFVEDESQAASQFAWWNAQAGLLLGAQATLLRPISVSPLK